MRKFIISLLDKISGTSDNMKEQLLKEPLTLRNLNMALKALHDVSTCTDIHEAKKYAIKTINKIKKHSE